MPIYAYKCPKCEVEEERLSSIEARDYQYCNSCNSLLERLISPVSFRLKGEGWAKDGYSGEKK